MKINMAFCLLVNKYHLICTFDEKHLPLKPNHYIYWHVIGRKQLHEAPGT